MLQRGSGAVLTSRNDVRVTETYGRCLHSFLSQLPELDAIKLLYRFTQTTRLQNGEQP